MTAAEALLLQLTKQGLEGDSAASRKTLRAVEQARQKQLTTTTEQEITATVFKIVGFNANGALEPLRRARKLDRYRKTAKMKLEPWVVEMALRRLDAPLIVPEQQIVHDATRTPKNVRWPNWWSVGLE